MKAVDEYVLTTSFFANAFCIVDGKSGRTLTSLSLSAQDQVNSGRMVILSASKCVNPTIANTIIRSVLLSVTVTLEEPVTDNSAAAPKKGNATALPDEPVLNIVTTVYVIETLTGSMVQQMPDTNPSKQKKNHHNSSIKSRVLHSIAIDSTAVTSASGPTDPSIFAKLDEITKLTCADISQDGEVLLLATNGKIECYCLQSLAATARMFSAPLDKKAKAAKKDAANVINAIEEETEVTDFGSNINSNACYTGLVLSTPNYSVPTRELLKDELNLDTESMDMQMSLQTLFFFSVQVLQQTYQKNKVITGKDGGVNPPASSLSKASVKSSKKVVEEGAPPKSNTLLNTNNLSLAVASTTLPTLSLYGLLYTEEKKIEAETEKTEPSTSNSNPATSGTVLCTEPMDKGIVTSYLLSTWTFPGLITSTATDSERALLVLGLNDGSVFLINLKSLSLLQCIGRHEVAITALSFCQSMTSPDYFIVSGAGDGTMCFFKIVTSNGEAPSGIDNMVPSFSFLGTTNNNNGRAGVVSSHQNCVAETRLKMPFGTQWSGCLRAILMDYRHDFTEPVLSLNSFSKYPIVIANSASTMLATMQKNLESLSNLSAAYDPNISTSRPGGGSYLAVYDVEAMQLMGKLALYEGMSAQNVAWKVASSYDSKYYTRRKRVSSVDVSGAANASLNDSHAQVLSTTSAEAEETLDTQSVDNGGSTSLSTGSASSSKEMFRRASKFSSTPIEVFDLLRSYSGLITCTSNTLCAVFLRLHSHQEIAEPVLSTFHISDIIEALIPGIKKMVTLYNENDYVSNIGTNGVKALPLFSALSIEERWSKNYTVNTIPTRLKSFYMNVPENNSIASPGKMQRSSSRLSRNGSPERLHENSFTKTKQLKTNTAGTNSYGKLSSSQILTEEKLIEYQQQLDPLAMHQDFTSTVLPIGEACCATIKAPREYVLNAITKNQSERNGRKNRLMKRISLLCEGLE